VTSFTRPSWDETWLAVAGAVAKRSLCVRDQVGAVIVSPQQRIVATGYNGPPAGFCHNEQPCSDWCLRGQVKRQLGWVMPRNDHSYEIEFRDGKTWLVHPQSRSHPIELTDEVARQMGFTPEYAQLEKDYSDCPALHAEANALSVCERSVREGGTIYITSNICWNCAKLTANSGLKRVVVLVKAEFAHRNSDKSYEFLEQCGLKVDLT